ncbi:hypothetical protein FSP39_016086 [Pinctada imbricata]|uniref:Uncharacterized protein n=1 Tax=Pinctada imbricata TaxID=66713 RepID=A0AA89CAZ0_PINIB|nr:hypothetical protein FSP39_016086 [Pinctada imbricata]
MSVNDDIIQPSSDSFWEIGKYMRTVKRIDNGYKLCDSLRSLIDQRSEIEKSYAKQLTTWSKKWNDFLDKGPEYGTTEGAWKGLLCEADNVADLHNLIAENLMTNVYTSIKQWQKENYHKSMMHFKETKEMEDGFKKAQKPWEKKYTKVMQNRKDYHAACRSEKSTANQENNARGDSAVSPDQLKKIQEKLRKCQQDVEATRQKYEASLNDLNSYNAKYMEDMHEVFSKCQDFEKRRLQFFRSTLFDFHQCVDLSCNPKFSQVYSTLHGTIGQLDPEKDLKWWSHNHGAEMAMNWPTFEEYSPDLQNITKKEKKTSQLGGNDGITITSIRHKPDSYNAPEYTTDYNTQTSRTSTVSSGSGTNNHQGSLRKISFDGFPSLRRKNKDNSAKHKSCFPTVETPPPNTNSQERIPSPPDSARIAQMDSVNSQISAMQNPVKKPLRQQLSYDESLNPFGDSDAEEDNVESHVYQAIDEARNDHSSKGHNSHNNNAPPVSGNSDGGNPFADDDNDIIEDSPRNESPRDPAKEGVPVRAIYDYEVTEDDELPLKAGDVFVKLSEEDELGWCKGYKDGREGLYPANYVEPV